MQVRARKRTDRLRDPQILEHRETGVPLKQQAVLFRASHHSLQLEPELSAPRFRFISMAG